MGIETGTHKPEDQQNDLQRLEMPKRPEATEANETRSEVYDHETPAMGDEALDIVAKERENNQSILEGGKAESVDRMEGDDSSDKPLNLSEYSFGDTSREIAEAEREQRQIEIKKQEEEANERAEKLLRDYA
jgi:hypothetical protein